MLRAASPLVMIGDEPFEEAHAEGGGAFRNGRRILLRPSGAGDVEMRPGYVVNEPLQELRRSDAARLATAADVFDVSRVAVHHSVVSIGERQAPYFLSHLGAGGDKALRQLVIVGEEPGML